MRQEPIVSLHVLAIRASNLRTMLLLLFLVSDFDWPLSIEVSRLQRVIVSFEVASRLRDGRARSMYRRCRPSKYPSTQNQTTMPMYFGGVCGGSCSERYFYGSAKRT